MAMNFRRDLHIRAGYKRAMDITIIHFPGTNREKDMADAVKHISGKAAKMVWHKETNLGNPDLIILPGGFSYGDYLRCGAMAAHSPIMREVIKKAEGGTPVFGVCNGFQMLMETGLLPGALMRNRSLKFVCKHVDLEVSSNDNRFLSTFDKGEILPAIPVAHGEGCYFNDENGLKSLEDNDQIAFRYKDNPNGSVADIAGITNKGKTILGMMPHPENALVGSHQGQGGRKLFEAIFKTLA